MAEIWKAQPKDVYWNWCQTLREEASDKLTSWEINFLDSIEGRLSFGNDLSKAQAETLEKIYTEKTK